MEKKVVFCIILSAAIFCLSAGSVMAGAEINNSNYTHGYFKDFTPFADADVIYNPARFAFEDYSSISAGMQVVFKDYGSGTPAESADDTSYIPHFAVNYHYSDTVSFVAAMYNTAGGGKLTFNNGNSMTQLLGDGILAKTAYLAQVNPAAYGQAYTLMTQSDHEEYLKGESSYPTIKLGIAGKYDDKSAVSAGLLLISAEKSVEGSVKFVHSTYGTITEKEIKYDQDASDTTYFLSWHYRPDERWNIAVNYTGAAMLSFDTDIKKDDLGIIKTEDVKEYLPATLSLGINESIKDTEYGDFEFKLGVFYFFQKDAIWDSSIVSGENDRQKHFHDGYEISYGVAWEPLSIEGCELHLGFLYSDPGADPNYTSTEKPALKSKSIGAGFDYKLSDKTTFNFALAKIFYDNETKDNDDDLEKKTFVFGAGIEYFF